MVAHALSPSPEPADLITVLSREQLIDRIGALNPGASFDFLSEFDDAALGLYLEHLHARMDTEDLRAVWRRPGDTAAVLMREPRDG